MTGYRIVGLTKVVEAIGLFTESRGTIVKFIEDFRNKLKLENDFTLEILRNVEI